MAAASLWPLNIATLHWDDILRSLDDVFSTALFIFTTLSYIFRTIYLILGLPPFFIPLFSSLCKYSLQYFLTLPYCPFQKFSPWVETVVPWGLCKSSCSTFSFAETFPYFISIPVSRIYVLTWRLGCVKGEGGGGRGCSGLSEETRCLSRGFCSESADCWRRCGAEESRRRRRSWLTKKTFTSLRLRTEKSAGTGRLYRYNQTRWHCQIWVRSHNRTVLQART